MFDLLRKCVWVLTTMASIFTFYPSKIFKTSTKEGPVSVTDNQIYDFVIVGGGTAGCIVANRLSEDPAVTVALLEAGGPEPIESRIPGIAPYLQLTQLDWQYKTEPSTTSCLAMDENRCNLPRGRVLGGSSSINFMLYVRGNRKDYDLWRNLGNPGWGYEDVLQYFKKSENNFNTIFADSKYHSTSGLQPITEPTWSTPLAKAFLEGGAEMGYTTVDVNGKSQVGFMFPQGFYSEGSRYSTSRAFLDPIKDRKNLHVHLNSIATGIKFDQNKRAIGVYYEKDGKSRTVLANKEVILCAGAFGSSQLLMISGIGPKNILEGLNISIIANLPVGRNLQDHISGIQTFVIDSPISLRRKRYESFASLYQYIFWDSGPLSTLGGVEGIAFLNTKYANVSSDWPDIQFMLLSGSYASDGGSYMRHAINLKESYWENYMKYIKDSDTFSILVKLMRPRSRGYLEILSKDIRMMPKIVTNYLADPYDVLVLSEGMNLAKTLGQSNAFKRFGSQHFSKTFPGCAHLPKRSGKYTECLLRHLTMTIYHYSGTAKMGPYWDSEAVVDSQLRVYGTAGLRVADASIFPQIPTGNTNAPVMMVAEKASDMIKNYWKFTEIQTGHREDSKNENAFSEKPKVNLNFNYESNTGKKSRRRRDTFDMRRLRGKIEIPKPGKPGTINSTFLKQTIQKLKKILSQGFTRTKFNKTETEPQTNEFNTTTNDYNVTPRTNQEISDGFTITKFNKTQTEPQAYDLNNTKNYSNVTPLTDQGIGDGFTITKFKTQTEAQGYDLNNTKNYSNNANEYDGINLEKSYVEIKNEMQKRLKNVENDSEYVLTIDIPDDNPLVYDEILILDNISESKISEIDRELNDLLQNLDLIESEEIETEQGVYEERFINDNVSERNNIEIGAEENKFYPNFSLTQNEEIKTEPITASQNPNSNNESEQIYSFQLENLNQTEVLNSLKIKLKFSQKLNENKKLFSLNESSHSNVTQDLYGDIHQYKNTSQVFAHDDL